VSTLKSWTDALSGTMNQSYKPIVALTIFELADKEISSKDFVNRVSEFFWQLETRFQLKHGPGNNEIHGQIIECMQYADNKERWNSVKNQLDLTVKRGRRARRDTIWAKLCEMPLEKLPTSEDDELYYVHADRIIIPESSIEVIKANRKALTTFARCRLGEFLEKFNSSSPRINQKVKIAWDKKRPTRPGYMTEILSAFHEKLECYLCGSQIPRTPDWDHVLPFSYIGGHDIWNFMPTCGPHSGNSYNCNQKKSARMPSDEEIMRTEERNKSMLKWLGNYDDASIKNTIIRNARRDLEFERSNNELRRLWNSIIG
jgi:hypothetical protein